MARQVIVSVHCGTEKLAPGRDFQALVLQQTLFDHHSLSLIVPFDSMEGSQAAFLNKASGQFLGQPISLSITPHKDFIGKANSGEGLTFKGFVTELGTSRDTDGHSSITVQGYSTCCQLAEGVQNRTFVKQTLASIFKEVLAPYPQNRSHLEHRIAPLHKAPIPYIAQYQESNFTFLSRLATEYGEWFFYDGTTLQLGPPAATTETDFLADGVHNNFHLGVSLSSTKVKFYDYSPRQHQHYTASTQAVDVAALSQHPLGKLALKQSDQLFRQESHSPADVRAQSSADLNEEAKAFKAQRVAHLVALQGNSDNPSLQLGGIVRVKGQGLGSEHGKPTDFGAYRLVEITHQIDAEGNYYNTFTAIPHLLELPPLNPHYVPPAGSQELADVIDTDDPDHLGRIRVRFHWPVAKPAQAESDWLRVLTPYAGDGKGQLFTPEKGSQVLVGYEHGLAEFPVVLGNLFHAQNQQGAKYTTEGNHRKGLQTAGGNKVVMSDKKGAQTILLSNSNNKGTAVEIGFQGDGSITIKSSGPVTVSGSVITLEAGEKGEIKMHAKNITIDAEEEIKVSSLSKSIALTAKQNITADAAEKMELSAKEKTVTTQGKLEISSSSTVDISGVSVKING